LRNKNKGMHFAASHDHAYHLGTGRSVRWGGRRCAPRGLDDVGGVEIDARCFPRWF
jgi:hypothetical protein